jgi:hypothetical protein
MIIDLLPEKAVNPIHLDWDLRVPSEYIPLSHLTSKKSVLVYEKERYYRHLHKVLASQLAVSRLGDSRVALYESVLLFNNDISNVPEERQACWTDSEGSHEGTKEVPRLMKTKLFPMHKSSLGKIRLTRPNKFWSTTDQDSQDQQSSHAQGSEARIPGIRHISLKSIVPRISSSIKVMRKPLSLVLNSSPQIRSRFASSEKLREKLFAQIIEVASSDPRRPTG